VVSAMDPHRRQSWFSRPDNNLIIINYICEDFLNLADFHELWYFIAAVAVWQICTKCFMTEDHHLLGCNPAYSSRFLLTFRSNLVSAYSESRVICPSCSSALKTETEGKPPSNM
jgi:hypothetical protein